MIKRKKKAFFNFDSLATTFGAVIGIAQLLVATEHINQKDGLLIAGLATIALGVVTNKKPQIKPKHDFSHLGVSTYQSIEPEMLDVISQQPPNQRMRELTRKPQEEPEHGSRPSAPDNQVERQSSQMGDRANPLDRESSPLDPDSSEY